MFIVQTKNQNPGRKNLGAGISMWSFVPLIVILQSRASRHLQSSRRLLFRTH